MMNWIFEVSDRYLQHGLEGLLITGLILFSIVVLLKALIKRLMMRLRDKNVLDQTGSRFASRILKVIMYTFVIVIVGAQIIPLKNLSVSLLAGSGIVVLIIGFAAQEAFSNIIAGFFISFFRPYSVGDLVHLPSENISGSIEDINLRHTIIRTYTNQAVVIPNSTMNKITIENRILGDKRSRNYFEMPIAYDSDIDLARQIMTEAIMKHPNLLDVRTPAQIANQEPLFKVILVRLDDYAMVLRAVLWSADFSSGWVMLNDLREQIKKEFDAAQIIIPLPTQNVNVRTHE